MNTGKQEDMANVLIAENGTEVARLILEILAKKGIRGHLVPDGNRALEFVSKGSCDLVFTGETINLQRNGAGQTPDGFELLEKLVGNWPELPVVMIADSPTPGSRSQRQIVARAVKAVRCGCTDVLVRPLDPARIEMLLDTFLPSHDLSMADSACEGTRCLYKIVGRSPNVIQTVELARRIAPTSAPVLISGDSGTGKELMAYLVHHNSRRAQGPYIKVNCAALSDSLLESELFGHEKGAFTGAHARRRGRFEMAHGGTLLLDEITETPKRFQAKLLRVLEQQDFERVGGSESVRVDVRIIITKNKDLLQEVQQGRFRRDLYYRLSGVRLVISPLRERKDDLSDLVWHFVNQYAREVQRRITKLDPAMMEIFAK
ncbi:MAG: sigma-54-dependent Fis family transcriptional regulator, partial [Phycisphaerales bacterium]